jgi:riboflavin biosynthesis pyrimidine reductase
MRSKPTLPSTSTFPSSSSFPVTRTVADIGRRLDALYGEVDWAAETGVLHVAAIAEGSWRAIVPGKDAPDSETDRFVLGAARARADVIITTGAILSSEPALRHEPSEDASLNRALLGWRRETLGRIEEPLLIVLTASGDLPIAHPALEAASGGFVWTTPLGAARLRSSFGESVGELGIIEDDTEEAAIRGAIRAALRRPGIATILVEAGPSATDPLYREGARNSDGIRCDELLLSRFEGELVTAASGPAFISRESIDAYYAGRPSRLRIEDASGVWTICRYRAT